MPAVLGCPDVCHLPDPRRLPGLGMASELELADIGRHVRKIWAGLGDHQIRSYWPIGQSLIGDVDADEILPAAHHQFLDPRH